MVKTTLRVLRISRYTINIFKAIFGLFRFILKQICLFWLFQNTFETPKQTETKFSLVSKMNRNKCETDPVLVIFGSNRNFFFIRFVDTLVSSEKSVQLFGPDANGNLASKLDLALA